MSRRGAGTAAVLTGEGARCAVSTQALSSRELQALHELTLAAVTARRRLPAPGACPRVGRRVCRIQSLTLVTVNCELCLASPVAYYCPPVFGPKKKEKRIFVILRSYSFPVGVGGESVPPLATKKNARAPLPLSLRHRPPCCGIRLRSGCCSRNRAPSHLVAHCCSYPFSTSVCPWRRRRSSPTSSIAAAAPGF